MYIAVYCRRHGSYKSHAVYTTTCVSIPLTLMVVDTRKDTSGGIIKLDINAFGVHLSMFH